MVFAAQLQKGCLSGSLSSFVSDSPFNVKANCRWSLLQQLRAVVVYLQGSVCINDLTLSADGGSQIFQKSWRCCLAGAWRQLVMSTMQHETAGE